MMEKKQLNDNDVDESIFSDDVQNAFANYENEVWKKNDISYYLLKFLLYTFSVHNIGSGMNRYIFILFYSLFYFL